MSFIPSDTTSTKTSALTLPANATLYISFYATDVTTKSYLLASYALSEMQLYIEGGKLIFKNPANFISGTQGKWTGDISVNTNYQMALRFLFDTDETQNPEVWLNGAQITMTETVTPIVSQAAANAQLEFGFVVDGTPFLGRIHEVAIFNTKLSDSGMAILSGSQLRNIPLQYSSVTNYWKLEEVAGGASIASVAFKDVVGGNTATGGTGTGFTNNYLSYP